MKERLSRAEKNKDLYQSLKKGSEEIDSTVLGRFASRLSQLTDNQVGNIHSIQVSENSRHQRSGMKKMEEPEDRKEKINEFMENLMKEVEEYRHK